MSFFHLVLPCLYYHRYKQHSDLHGRWSLVLPRSPLRAPLSGPSARAKRSTADEALQRDWSQSGNAVQIQVQARLSCHQQTQEVKEEANRLSERKKIYVKHCCSPTDARSNASVRRMAAGWRGHVSRWPVIPHLPSSTAPTTAPTVSASTASASSTALTLPVMPPQKAPPIRWGCCTHHASRSVHLFPILLFLLCLYVYLHFGVVRSKVFLFSLSIFSMMENGG